MPLPPERILLFRSGRHLRTAMAALQTHSPGCDITVVTTAGGVASLDEAGIVGDRRLVYDRAAFFHPWAFARSPVAARAIAGRFDRVCVLWNDPAGTGQSNVDRTAMLVSPGGFTAITADGQLVVRRTWPILGRELGRAARSAALLAALGLLVFVPARVVRDLRM